MLFFNGHSKNQMSSSKIGGLLMSGRRQPSSRNIVARISTLNTIRMFSIRMFFISADVVPRGRVQYTFDAPIPPLLASDSEPVSRSESF